jgi:hypothetical protein
MTTTSTVSLSSDLLPTVRNIEEARATCADFDGVLTVGPDYREVHDFGHPEHKVITFDDITVNLRGYHAPTFELVREAVEWGTGRTNLLVHCHAGMSRSTSTAWGIAIANGFEPLRAYELLKQRHPIERLRTWSMSDTGAIYTARRAFIPNELVLKHLERLFGLNAGTLREIAAQYNSD